MKNLNKLLQEYLSDPKIKAEYDELEPEFQVVRAMLEARREHNLTQQQLANLTGIDRADISKLETGSANPTLKMLKRLAEGMDMVLKLDFVPKRIQ